MQPTRSFWQESGALECPQREDCGRLSSKDHVQNRQRLRGPLLNVVSWSLPRIARRDDVRLLTSSPSGHVFDDEQIAAHEVLPTNLNLGRIGSRLSLLGRQKEEAPYGGGRGFFGSFWGGPVMGEGMSHQGHFLYTRPPTARDYKPAIFQSVLSHGADLSNTRTFFV